MLPESDWLVIHSPETCITASIAHFLQNQTLLYSYLFAQSNTHNYVITPYKIITISYIFSLVNMLLLSYFQSGAERFFMKIW